MKTKFNLEKLASFSLKHTGEYCPHTMLAQFAATNPEATDLEVLEAEVDIMEFVKDAI